MDHAGEQMALVRAEAAHGKARAASAPPAALIPAQRRPVARVVVDVEPVHLDRLWDYTVPQRLAEQAQPGVRVRVRFAGQLVDGYLWERAEQTEFGGRLAPLHSVVSPEPVLTPEIGRLVRTVADAYAGTVSDVLRLAIPPRHARAEKAAPRPAAVEPPAPYDPQPWKYYANGPELLTALAAGHSPRAVWTALAGSLAPDWARALAAAVHATLNSGRSAVVVVPDGRDVGRMDVVLTELLGPGRHVALTADLGAGERYSRWLAAKRGAVRCVVGTRAAMFVPLPDLGLVALWDDGDSSLADRTAPYPHVREVLTIRAHQTGAAALIGGYAVTAEAAQLVARRWARPVAAPRAVVREHAPMVRTADPDREAARDAGAAIARIPALAWGVARDGLQRGPVLVQVPRTGYLPALACVRCRQPAHCAHCRGPLALAGSGDSARCRWCNRIAGHWRCDRCGASRFRARATGAARSAEELGRAFPGVPVRLSRGGAILTEVGPQPALVVATPGAEPPAAGGYAAALLLDGDLLLGVPTLRAAEQALRRWLAAAALVRPASDGGVVAVAAEPTAAPVQALVRWDPAAFARRELADRADLGYPPAARIAELTAPYAALDEFMTAFAPPQGAEILGPTPAPGGGESGEQLHRVLIRCPRAAGRPLVEALKATQGVRSARKAPAHVRIRIDPADLA
ncbi:primosomal protein N' [Actinocrinis puniceicyclus]|uniref:Probable replication restart protein PriA n=1 Tax=Actinocrinis puniceicyclus TaxID=977794 RepID=A0A8J7WT34_9ACTN|nr:primosomal protein N' [Actinocrinis puniceicyclus]MBS2965507.1 primosomal protein N' [Actinocrinis puniceicyclus]